MSRLFDPFTSAVPASEASLDFARAMVSGLVQMHFCPCRRTPCPGPPPRILRCEVAFARCIVPVTLGCAEAVPEETNAAKAIVPIPSLVAFMGLFPPAKCEQQGAALFDLAFGCGI